MAKMFLDFEFNQGKRLKSEVISIGGVVIEDNGKELTRYYRVCKPVVNTILDRYVSKVVTITQEDLDNGIDFEVMCEELLGLHNTYDIANYYVYGNNDISSLRATANVHKNLDVLERIITKMDNIQPLICSSIKRGNEIVSKYWALSMLNDFYQNVKLESHDALNDAVMLCNIYNKYLKYGDIDVNNTSVEYDSIPLRYYDDIRERNKIMAEEYNSMFFDSYNGSETCTSTKAIVDAWNRLYRKKKVKSHLVFKEENSDKYIFTYIVDSDKRNIKLIFEDNIHKDIETYSFDANVESINLSKLVCKKIRRGIA